MISLWNVVTKIYNLLLVLKTNGVNSLGQGGWRVVGAMLCPVWVVSAYNLLYWLCSALFVALSALCTDLPASLATVAGVVSGASGGVDLGWLSWANYILPIDFFVTCLCLYFTAWTLCFIVGLYFKLVDFLSEARGTTKLL